MILKSVLMKSTRPGTIDGYTIQKFEKGKEYDITESLFDSFVNKMKCAIPVDKPSTSRETLAEKKKREKNDAETEKRLKREEAKAKLEESKLAEKERVAAEKKRQEEIEAAKDKVTDVNNEKEEATNPENKEATAPENKEAGSSEENKDDSEEEDKDENKQVPDYSKVGELDDFVIGD
ncbi:hypothetical protein KAR91_01065 [Candidatus Pacearchaeota archaeon]|nr:hypothetical protein [Candidatus Pacearchaeota archaeon]